MGRGRLKIEGRKERIEKLEREKEIRTGGKGIEGERKRIRSGGKRTRKRTRKRKRDIEKKKERKGNR